MQRSNTFYIAFLILCLTSCNSQGQILEEENKAPSKEPLEKTANTDSGSSTKSLFEQITKEATNDIYHYINAELKRDELSAICEKFKNTVVIINLTVEDSIITSGYGKVYEFNAVGNLIKYSDGADEITALFISKEALMFSFIDSYKIAYYDFRIDMSKLCE